MKNIVTILILSLSQQVMAQSQFFNDTIISNDADTIICKISLVNNFNIFYQFNPKKKKIVSTHIERSKVHYFSMPGKNVTIQRQETNIEEVTKLEPTFSQNCESILVKKNKLRSGEIVKSKWIKISKNKLNFQLTNIIGKDQIKIEFKSVQKRNIDKKEANYVEKGQLLIFSFSNGKQLRIHFENHSRSKSITIPGGGDIPTSHQLIYKNHIYLTKEQMLYFQSSRVLEVNSTVKMKTKKTISESKAKKIQTTFNCLIDNMK